jgi:hypothetical protein
MVAYFAPSGNHSVFSTQRRKGAEKQSFLIACGAFGERGDWEVGEFYFIFIFVNGAHLAFWSFSGPAPTSKNSASPPLCFLSVKN